MVREVLFREWVFAEAEDESAQVNWDRAVREIGMAMGKSVPYDSGTLLAPAPSLAETS